MESAPVSLRIDTSLSTGGLGAPNSPLESPSALFAGRQRARSLSQTLLPQLRLSIDKSSSGRQSDAGPERPTMSLGMEKARNESRKLLSHILAQLEERSVPPPLLEGSDSRTARSRKGIAAVVRSLSGKGKAADAKQANTNGNDDSDEDYDPNNRPVFFTDATLKLMGQLRDTLHISLANNWDIFAAGSSEMKPGRQNSFEKRRRKRRLSSQGRSRSRSASPSRYDDEPSQAPELLSQCITILSSVIVEDCRFRVYALNLAKPPYSLQGVTLDVAQILLHMHRDEPRILSRIGFTLMPAFQSFPTSMHARLLQFFEEGVLGGMLENLQKMQGKDPVTSPANEPLDEQPPVVSITVEEAQDEVSHSDRWKRWSKRATGHSQGCQSSSAPEQDITVYYLASLVEPLLSAILENVNLFTDPSPVTHRFHRFFTRLMQEKPDVYLDVLGVIAYHNSKSRYAATSLLLTYWPRSTGHVVISRPLPKVAHIAGPTFPDRRSSITRRTRNAVDHPYAHQFMPWRFALPASSFGMFGEFSSNRCRACSDAVDGFGLLCPFCMCAVHFDCYDYPEGSFFTEYALQSDPNIRKVAVHRFCHVLPSRHGSTTLTVRKEQHVFRMVNTFSMSLCCLCQTPLWGTVSQGYKCGACHLFVHPSCLSEAANAVLPRCRGVNADSSLMTISYVDLRQSFIEHYRDLIWAESDLAAATYEEVTVLFSTLWNQLQILNNGMALGSVVITLDHASESGEMEDFELHYLVSLYESYLSSGHLPVSSSLEDYLSENNLRAKDYLAYFDWNTLAFMASVVKLPPSSEAEGVDLSALLSVSQVGATGLDDEPPYPYEMASLAHVRDRMGDALGLHHDAPARQLLVHLHHLGLLERHDARPALFEDAAADPESLQICFPLPFGFDITLEVETLVATIEACLSDHNLSLNEVGLLLLVRRFWPNGMLSDYSFRRLVKAILSWILSEDGNLALILREYVARNKNLPGVRSGEAQSWPTQSLSRPTTTITASNGGDYVASRKALLQSYATPWMLALHDLDVAEYGNILYDLLIEYAEEGTYTDPFILGERGEADTKARKKRQVGIADRFLRAIIKISQASIAFTAFDELFQRWFERMRDSEGYEVAVPALPRLFTREDGSSRHSLVFDGRSSVGDLAGLINVNPLQSLMAISFASRDGYQRGLRWLCIFASSGVDIPVSLFYQFASEAGRFRADLEDCLVLTKAGLYSAWLRAVGRQELQNIAGMLHEHLSSDLISKLWSGESGDALMFIRLSLAMCLLLYGCDRQYVISLDFVKQEEMNHLPSRRKIGSRASTMTDPIIVDSRLMAAIKLYVEQHVDELSCLLAKFLNTFVNEAQLVESYEVDNFILRNCVALSACMWDFYAIQLPELSLKRAALFVRVMVVDSQPFLALLLAQLRHEDWEIRLEGILRLFRIVLDVTSTAFVAEGRQWGLSVVDVFYYFFSAMWTDDKEEIRLAVDTWSQTLLPAHHEAIMRCWNETLSRAPISEKLKLINFLCQLRSHFPAWKVLAWETIIEALLESEFMARNGHLEDGAAAAHLSLYGLSSKEGDEAQTVSDPDSFLLRAALISLSLRMIADGITVELFSLLKLKHQLLLTFGYRDVSLVPSSNGQTFYVQFGELDCFPPVALPCIADLMLVLDSAQPCDISSSAMGGPDVDDETKHSLLIGSVFVDILVDLSSHLSELGSSPPLVLKNLLKTLIIAMQKHDFDSQPLRYLHSDLRKALRCALMMYSDEGHLSLELRQLALSACQVFITRWPDIMGPFIYEAIESVTKVMVSLHYEEHPEDSLVVQSRMFLEGLMTTFYGRGILNVLFKRVLSPDFFKVLNKVLGNKPTAIGQPNLKDALLYDTLSRAPNNEGESYQTVLDNLGTFVEIVHHSAYTIDMLEFVGLSFTNIAHKVSDWTVDTFDASSLLLMSATLIQYNKSHSRIFIPQVATVLHLLLGKCRLSSAALSHVLQVTAALYRKAEQTPNLIVVTFLESVSEILSSKGKSFSSTFPAALEVVISNVGLSCIARESLLRLAEDGFLYLHSYNAMSPWHQDFVSCQAVAKIVLRAAEESMGTLRHLENNPLGVRTWNAIVLAGLSVNGSQSPSLLLRYFHAFVLPYYTSLEPLQAISEHQGLGDVESNQISRAYIAIKLWLLVVLRLLGSGLGTSSEESTDIASLHQCRMVWNELWPPFEAVVINLLHVHGAANSLLLASSSVADLFLFLHQTRIIISLETSSQVALLTQLQANSRLESKISRVLRSLTEPPPNNPIGYYVSQIAAEISAEEKLEAARLQESMKPIWDRGRRVVS